MEDAKLIMHRFDILVRWARLAFKETYFPDIVERYNSFSKHKGPVTIPDEHVVNCVLLAMAMTPMPALKEETNGRSKSK